MCRREVPLREGYRVMSGAGVGAVAGSLIAWPLFTPQGRRFRTQINPALEECSELLVECRRTLRAAQQVGREARAVVEELRMPIAGNELR